MKQAFDDDATLPRALEHFAVCHSLLTMVREEMRKIENLYFSLIGEQFGKLLVRYRRDVEVQEDTSFVVVPAWLCDCDCGTELQVRHDDLVKNKITSCGACEDHAAD